ncbi:hypothetical protein B0H66DRAFT_604626 [Apodospora peruviana]|uniref:Uncharacterized protein n=1 Tax=Apodospora peruviana TaxID=516989 RepID=A0AAE0I0N5_9PEZI|nr:hypothetical protein B0H66DRAFT_604626 [Apodospora peruviana]
MAWELSTWLALIRTFQVLGALAASALNGFVTVMIYLKADSLPQNVGILELLICLVLCYTTVTLIVQHTRQRSKKLGYLRCFLLLDIVACGIVVAILYFLTKAKLPSNCRGLNPSDIPSPDGDEPPHQPFTTISFSDEGPGHRGELDKHCAFERSYFFIAIGLAITFIATITLTILRIRERKRHARSAKDSEMQDDDVDLKTLDASSPLTLTPTPSSQAPPPAAPPSEGIITRNTSMRSTVTASTGYHSRQYSWRASVPPAPLSEGIITRNPSIRSTMTSSTASHGRGPSFSSHRAGAIPARRPVGGGGQMSPPAVPPVPLIGSHNIPVRRPVLPPRPTPPYEAHRHSHSGPNSSVGNSGGMLGQQGFIPVPLEDDDDDNADFGDALVADGMQHQQRHQREQQAQYTRQRMQMMQMPMLPEDEQTAAESALVSDGMRDPSEPMLPPYEPGPNRMAGHNQEDNETRLSGYVKGQTRAQDMKDSGRY